MEGDLKYSVTVEQKAEADGEAVWVFRADAEPGIHHQNLRFVLSLADYGLPPQPVENAELWVWGWQVSNVKTADYVEFNLLTAEGRTLHLCASHAIFDYRQDYVRAPELFRRVSITVPEAERFRGEMGGEPPEPVKTIVGVRLTINLPYQQEVWLSQIEFGPMPEKPPPPTERAPIYRAAEGVFFPVDLDGDGVAEVITPWFFGDKVWRFDQKAGDYRLTSRGDILSRTRPLHLMVGGDLDGDGDTDLIAVDPDQETFFVLKQRAWGFSADSLRVPLPERPARVTALALGDDDHDQRLELFIGYNMLAGPCIYRLDGQPEGGFGPATAVPTSTKGQELVGTYFVSLADMDGDGNRDLITCAQSRAAHILPGDGLGGYGEAIAALWYLSASFFRDLEVADVNGDGLPDLYLCNRGSYNEPNVRGENLLGINRGNFQFEDRAVSAGVTGGRESQDACLVDVDGRPGLELVALEEGTLLSYSLEDAAVLMSEPPDQAPTLPMRHLIADNGDLRLGHRLFCQDLDGDGRLEAVLSLDDRPLVMEIPDSGPVKNFRSGRFGPNSGRIGASVKGTGPVSWSLPLLSTNRMGPMALTLAAAESATVVEADMPASSWWESRFPVLWEYPVAWVRSPLGTIVLIGLTLGGIGAWGGPTYFRSRRRSRMQSWDDLLQMIGLTEHAGWRSNLLTAEKALRHAAARRDGGQSGVEAFELVRRAAPQEMLDMLSRIVDTARHLDLDGARRAGTAMRTVSQLFSEKQLPLDAAADAFVSLHRSLDLISDAVREHHSSMAPEVLANARNAVLAQFPAPGVEIRWEVDGIYETRRFPMGRRDLYAVLEEALTNALKKDPPPGVIQVSASLVGRRAHLVVKDDGPPLEVEAVRPDRPGLRSGLLELQERIPRLYRGSVTLQNTADGGVALTVIVPDLAEG